TGRIREAIKNFVARGGVDRDRSSGRRINRGRGGLTLTGIGRLGSGRRRIRGFLGRRGRAPRVCRAGRPSGRVGSIIAPRGAAATEAGTAASATGCASPRATAVACAVRSTPSAPSKSIRGSSAIMRVRRRELIVLFRTEAAALRWGFEEDLGSVFLDMVGGG